MAATGLCACGCGRETSIARQTHRKYGWVKGEPVRYVLGHSSRTTHRSKTKEAMKNAALRHNYGIDLATFEIMREAQGGCCYICGELTRKLNVDHDHATGKIRKLLCNTCNTRLGAVENREFLLRATLYLEEHA